MMTIDPDVSKEREESKGLISPHGNNAPSQLGGLLGTIERWRGEDLTIGFTCGAFDILHAGHVDYLEKAKRLCDRLVVAVNSDSSIRRYKNPHRPIVNEQDRIKLVGSLRCVDAVIVMEETSPAALIRAIRPDVYIKGGDYKKEQLKSAPVVESYGGRCEIIAVEHMISTSRIIQRIEEVSRYAEPEQSSVSSEPIAFLDRDGTLIEHLPFPSDPSRIRLREGVGDGLRLLQDHGYRLIIITNQQGIGLGYLSYDQFVATNSVMLEQLSRHQVTISKFYYCPHSLADNCECRKPRSALIRRALVDFNADPSKCIMIGDAVSDMLAAERAGCNGILLSGGGPNAWPNCASSFIGAAKLSIKLANDATPGQESSGSS